MKLTSCLLLFIINYEFTKQTLTKYDHIIPFTYIIHNLENKNEPPKKGPISLYIDENHDAEHKPFQNIIFTLHIPKNDKKKKLQKGNNQSNHLARKDLEFLFKLLDDYETSSDTEFIFYKVPLAHVEIEFFRKNKNAEYDHTNLKNKSIGTVISLLGVEGFSQGRLLQLEAGDLKHEKDDIVEYLFEWFLMHYRRHFCLRQDANLNIYNQLIGLVGLKEFETGLSIKQFHESLKGKKNAKRVCFDLYCKEVYADSFKTKEVEIGIVSNLIESFKSLSGSCEKSKEFMDELEKIEILNLKHS
jgi:hypothetical protein